MAIEGYMGTGKGASNVKEGVKGADGIVLGLLHACTDWFRQGRSAGTGLRMSH